MLEERRVLRTSHTRNNHQPELHEESHLSVENMKLTFGYLDILYACIPECKLIIFRLDREVNFKKKRKEN